MCEMCGFDGLGFMCDECVFYCNGCSRAIPSNDLTRSIISRGVIICTLDCAFDERTRKHLENEYLEWLKQRVLPKEYLLMLQLAE